MSGYRELSFVVDCYPRWKKNVIRFVEMFSRRRSALRTINLWRRRYKGKPRSVLNLLDIMGYKYDLRGLKNHLPHLSEKPLVIIANHPYGMVDGLAATGVAEMLGRPYWIMLNKDQQPVREVSERALTIDFAETKDAARHNIRTRNQALKVLESGDTVIIFPSGTVATSPKVFGEAIEPDWKLFVSKMVMESKADVLPIYFFGKNSPLFQFVSLFSQPLRYAMITVESGWLQGRTLHARIGELITFDDLRHGDDRAKLAGELRERVYALKVDEREYHPIKELRQLGGKENRWFVPGVASNKEWDATAA